MLVRTSCVLAVLAFGLVVCAETSPAAAGPAAVRGSGLTAHPATRFRLARRIAPAISFAVYPYLNGVANLWPAVSPDGDLWFPAIDYLPGGGVINTYQSVLVRMTPTGTFSPHVLETCTIPKSSIFYVCTPIAVANDADASCIDLGNYSTMPGGSVEPGPYSVVAGKGGWMWFTYGGLASQNGSGSSDGFCGLGVVPTFGAAEFFTTGNDFVESLTDGPDKSLWLWYWGGGTFSAPLPAPLSDLALFAAKTPREYLTCTIGSDHRVWCLSNAGSGPGAIDVFAVPRGPGKPKLAASYPAPCSNGVASNLVGGSDGNLWFTCYMATSPYNSQLVRVTPQGAMLSYALGGQWSFTSLTVGPHGNLWFSTGVQRCCYELGYFTASGQITVVASTSPSGGQALLPFAMYPLLGAPNGTLYGMGPTNNNQNSAVDFAVMTNAP